MAPSKEVALRPGTSEPQVNPDQTLKASKALLAHMKKAAKEKAEKADKKDLLAASDDDDEAAGAAGEPVWLTLTTKRHMADSRSLKPGKLALPHPLNTDPEMSVCLITAEPQRAYKNLVADPAFPAEWRKRVTRVIDLKKLRAKFRAYEAQRQLFADHDIFLGDSRIINRLPQALGKTFYKSTAKRPIPVDIQARVPKGPDGKRVKKAAPPKTGTAADKEEETAAAVNACTPAQLAGEVERAVGAALVSLSPAAGTSVKVAYAGWTAQQVADNAAAAAEALVARFVPGKWRNVRGLYLKGSATAALPVWLTEELWLDHDRDVVADGSDRALALLEDAKDGGKKKTKPNVGKKRKSPSGDDEGDDTTAAATSKSDEAEPAQKKSKKAKASAAAGGGSDDKLDKEIAQRKEALKKQKKAAKKAIDV